MRVKPIMAARTHLTISRVSVKIPEVSPQVLITFPVYPIWYASTRLFLERFDVGLVERASHYFARVWHSHSESTL